MVVQATRELDFRANDGVEVALLWHPGTNRLTVAVRDTRSGEEFELEVSKHDPLDVFDHPYAYAPGRRIWAVLPRAA